MRGADKTPRVEMLRVCNLKAGFYEHCNMSTVKAGTIREEPPIYESRRTWQNMFQRYMLFRDRIELRTLFGFYKIPLQNIVSIDKRPATLKSPLSEPRSITGIKLDFSDLQPHISLTRSTGVIKTIRFTPDDLDGFLSAVRAMRSKIRA